MAKRYYWLKLQEDFFREKRIKKLRRIAGGDTFVIIYLKLQLLSLENEGMITYEGLENNFIEEMALTLDEDIDNVSVTINFLKSCGLLVESDIPNEYLMPQTQKSIGSEGASAERVRKYREKQLLDVKPNKSYTLKRQQQSEEIEYDSQVSVKCQTHGDIDKISLDKTRLDKSSKDNVGKPDRIPYKEIIDFLNEKTESKYRYTTSKTKDLIKARWNDGFRLDDFKTVILKKTKEWKGKDMAKYLRPETLFGTKFESYLNQLDGGKADTKVDWFEEYEKEQRGERGNDNE